MPRITRRARTAALFAAVQLGSSLGASYGHALQGEYLPASVVAPRALCVIEELTPTASGLKRMLCSGTLVNRGQVLTAARCGPRTSIGNVRIFCDDGHVEAKVTAFTAHRSYGGDRGIALNDAGTYQVSFERTAPPPSDVELNPARVDALLAGECRAWGYGRDNEGLDGEARGVSLVHGDTSFESSLRAQFPELRSARYVLMSKNTGARGDSGGPIVCKDGDRWVQVAVMVENVSPKDSSKPFTPASWAEKLPDLRDGLDLR